jgi:hypothetical protein
MANDSSTAGRIYLLLVGLALALVGGIFCWLMWRSYDRAHTMRQWPEVPCVILESRVEERRIDPNSPPEFRFAVQYGYEWEGQRYTGEHWTWRASPWSSSREKAEQNLDDFPVGSASTCRVDPSKPAFAVLKVDSQGPGYSIWFPALFVVGGLGIATGGLIGRGGATPSA